MVCGYNQMEPLELGIICPSCGTQYGVSDEDATYPELRHRWISADHARWWSRYTTPPVGWSAVAQLRSIGYKCTASDMQKINEHEPALVAKR